MTNFQRFVGSGIAILDDATALMWDDLYEDGEPILISQPYLGNFYSNLGWHRLFPQERDASKARARKKFYSNRKVSVREIKELQDLSLRSVF
jgi:hypothetical protein